jgi:hypothetical protein
MWHSMCKPGTYPGATDATRDEPECMTRTQDTETTSRAWRAAVIAALIALSFTPAAPALGHVQQEVTNVPALSTAAFGR